MQQTSLSVKDITSIVQNIQNETANVVESLKVGYQEVEQGTIQINETSETFNRITLSVTEDGESKLKTFQIIWRALQGRVNK